jgi:hypothetical protein
MNGANKREYRVRSLQFIVDNQIIQKCNFPPSQFTDIDACHRRGKGLVFLSIITGNTLVSEFRKHSSVSSKSKKRRKGKHGDLKG